jgi:hypothetical protein
VHRAESLNDSPTFIRALADIAAEHLGDYSNRKIGPRALNLVYVVQGAPTQHVPNKKFGSPEAAGEGKGEFRRGKTKRSNQTFTSKYE